MDFGEILRRWESGGFDDEGGKPKRRDHKRGGSADRGDEMERLLELYPPSEESIRDRDGDSASKHGADSHRRIKPEAVIDLHGMTASQAWSALDSFMTGAHARGLSKVLIVHGKGNHSGGDPVLKRIVRQYLEQCRFAGRTGEPGRDEGGSGAVWVMLRRDYRSR